MFAWALAGLLNMHRDAIATDITVVKGEAHGDIVMRDQRAMTARAQLAVGALNVRIGYGGDSAALDGIVSWSSSDRGIVAVMADVVRWVDELIPALVSGS